jgi:hypothetical protein
MPSTPRKIVLIRSEDGTVHEYVPFSERLPDFLEEYPIEQGYRVVIDHDDRLSTMPGLLDLYRDALSNGRQPNEVGLPDLLRFPQVVFTAKLIHQGQVVRTASAKREIVYYKDWEVGETAAYQRLLAALGFGSSDFDRDEEQDQHDQGLRLQSRSATAPEAPPAAAGAAPAVTPVTKDDTSTGTRSEPDQNRPPTPQLRRQIRDLAAQLNAPVPGFQTQGAALQIYRDLLHRAKDRGAPDKTEDVTVET